MIDKLVQQYFALQIEWIIYECDKAYLSYDSTV